MQAPSSPARCARSRNQGEASPSALWARSKRSRVHRWFNWQPRQAQENMGNDCPTFLLIEAACPDWLPVPRSSPCTDHPVARTACWPCFPSAFRSTGKSGSHSRLVLLRLPGLPIEPPMNPTAFRPRPQGRRRRFAFWFRLRAHRAGEDRSLHEAEILMFRFGNGKIADLWATWDRSLEQLGAIDLSIELALDYAASAATSGQFCSAACRTFFIRD